MNRLEFIEKYATDFMLEKVAAKKTKKPKRGGFWQTTAGGLAAYPLGAAVSGPIGGLITSIPGGVVAHYMPGSGPGALTGGALGGITGGLISGAIAQAKYPEILGRIWEAKSIREVLQPLKELRKLRYIPLGLGAVGAGLGGYLGYKHWGKER